MFCCEFCEISKTTCFEEHLRTAASEVTLGSNCLVLSFWTVTFDHPYKYQSLSNQDFKYNSAHMPSLNLTPKLSFEPRFRIFIINDYDRKSKRLQSLDFLYLFVSVFLTHVSR